MGSTSSRKSLKEEYLALVERQKLIYAQTHPSLYSSPRLLDWRTDVYQDLKQVVGAVPWASWPTALFGLLDSWDILKDERWKSSLLWHDYLRTYQLQRSAVGVSTRSTLAIPLPSPTVPSSTESISFIDFLRTHFEAVKTNAIAAMISLFVREFRNFYSLNTRHEESFELAIDIENEDDLHKVTKEVHLFITLCINAFSAYYKGVDLTQFLSPSLSEIKDLITDLVFRSPVSEVMLRVFQATGAEKQRQIDLNIEKYSYLACEDLGISPYFCIDRDKADGRSSGGYDKAIVCLKSMAAAPTPMSKLKAITKSTRLLCECIDDFWEDNPDIEKDELIVNADQILSIYLYIVLKAKIKQLWAHLGIMQEFLRKDVKQSTMGYYLSTIEASLENIALLNPEFLVQLKQSA